MTGRSDLVALGTFLGYDVYAPLAQPIFGIDGRCHIADLDLAHGRAAARPARKDIEEAGRASRQF